MSLKTCHVLYLHLPAFLELLIPLQTLLNKGTLKCRSAASEQAPHLLTYLSKRRISRREILGIYF